MCLHRFEYISTDIGFVDWQSSEPYEAYIELHHCLFCDEIALKATTPTPQQERWWQEEKDKERKHMEENQGVIAKVRQEHPDASNTDLIDLVREELAAITSREIVEHMRALAPTDRARILASVV